MPLSGKEALAFDCVFDLLTVYGRGNKRLFCTAIDHPQSRVAKHGCRIAFRAMQCSRELTLAHYRARRELPPEVWEELNELLLLAEQEGIATASAHAASPPQSVLHLYVETALTHLVHPFGQSARDLRVILAFAREWAPFAKMRPTHAAAAAIVVDLDSNEPPSIRRMESTVTRREARVIDLSEAKHFLIQNMRSVEKEAAVAGLDFPLEQSPQNVLPLFQHLYKSWFTFPQARRFKRRIVTDRVEVVVGASAIHRALGTTLARRTLQRELGESHDQNRSPTVAPAADEAPKDPTIADWEPGRTPPALERWDLLDEGPDGFRIRRRELGSPINDRQLVAIKPPGAKSFILTQTRWLMTGIDGSITLGIHALAGLPQSVMIHTSTGGSAKTHAVPGFTPSKTNDSPSTVVASRGSLSSGATVEIESNASVVRVRLAKELENGHDFDMLTYSVQS
ncbi:MAG: hypothetical protein EXR39_07375 [Betaproteobacteria bacterium]|nr:hypothetical protein [Betaproteobacteria bacterium]